MSLHLAEISRHVAQGAHAVLVLDGAGWHGAASLAIPDNLTLLPLPSYSPELNPVENVWQYLRQNPAQLARLARLPSHPRDLLPGLERSHGHAGEARLHHPARVGESGRKLGPLVLRPGKET
jgi:hypothetical protein